MDMDLDMSVDIDDIDMTPSWRLNIDEEQVPLNEMVDAEERGRLSNPTERVDQHLLDGIDDWDVQMFHPNNVHQNLK